ncbi:DUF4926 domain-containing protein [Azonexus hydrophilus]|uniref:DUF4926 domain-containing protein n=1 Tax=Azonexus hydrophilus TaxID=418702 RepID=UPI001964D8CB
MTTKNIIGYLLFDVVMLAEDGLAAGMLGAVINVYTEPTEAYEVEFCDSQGRTLALRSLLPSQLRRKTIRITHE